MGEPGLNQVFAKDSIISLMVRQFKSDCFRHFFFLTLAQVKSFCYVKSFIFILKSLTQLNMDNILDARIVLVLNRVWRPIGHVTVKKAFENLFSESHGHPAALAVDMETAVDENGEEVLVNATPMTWNKWIQLPVRHGDLAINTAHRKIRVPTVIVAANYDKIPMCSPRLTKQAIFERDGGVCQYTGEYVGKSGGNIDHIHPRDLGGRDSFDNLVWCKKDINSRKGNKPLRETGLRLIRQPKAPPAMPRIIRREEAKHPSWLHFLDI